MASNPQIKAVITAEDRASATLNKFGNNVNGVSSKISKGLKVAAVGIAAGAAAAVAFGYKSVNAYSEAQKASKQLEHAVLQVTKASRKQLQQTNDLADALERKGVLDGDNIKMGLAQLSTFGLSNKAVQKLGGSLADLAVNQFGVSASGEQLSDTANMIAKALNGQFGILEKSGIRFNAAQKEAIKFGTEMEKVKAINEGFAQNLKYTNDVALTTYEGKLASLKVSFENIQESIGQVIVNGLTPFIGKLAEFVKSDQFQLWLTNLTNWLQVNLPIAVNYVVETLIPNLINIFNAVWPVIKTVIEWLGKFINFLANHEVALWTFIGVIGTMKAAFFMGSVVKSFQGSMKAIAATYKLTSAVLGTPILITIAIGAALIAMELIRRKANETWDTLNNLGKAVAGMKSAQSDARARLERLAQTGTKEQRARASSQLQKGTAAGSFATGGFTGRGGTNEFAGVVHKGEYVLPKSQVNQNTGQPNMGGSTTINISVPMMTGSANERRKVARMLIKDIQDIASMNGKGVTDMLSSNYGLIS